MVNVETLVQDIRDNVPIKPLPSPLLLPSLCILDAVYLAQHHYQPSMIRMVEACLSTT